MVRFDIEIIKMSDKALLINWPQRIEESILDDIIGFTQVIRTYYDDRLTNFTPAYASLLIQLGNDFEFEKEKKVLVSLYLKKRESKISKPKTWEIPVCYDIQLSIDTENFAEKGIDHKTLVQLHTSVTYRVFMIGFLPGFLYLGGLPEKLHLPRKSTPNLKTPKGAIAIGGEQTGIYPNESPGGWHVIGQTPLELFDINKSDPTPIRQGDNVKFYSVSLETFQHLL